MKFNPKNHQRRSNRLKAVGVETGVGAILPGKRVRDFELPQWELTQREKRE